MAKRMILTVQEKQKLLDIIAPHIQRLESKESGVGATMAKQAAWRTVLIGGVSCFLFHPSRISDSTEGHLEEPQNQSKERRRPGQKREKENGRRRQSMSRMIADLLPQQMNPAIEECGLRHIMHADDTHD